MDVSALLSGVYVIDINDKKGNVQKKFIKEE
ncbi:T9SS type A sorting domain-containing protein [Chryseobacterium indoltheticum]